MIKRLLLWNEISAVRLLLALTCLYALALPGIGHAFVTAKLRQRILLMLHFNMAGQER